MLHCIIIYISKANWRDGGDNLLSFMIVKGFSVFLGLFTSISSYFEPEVALKSQNTPNSGG